jgi:hypothetical protein
VVDPHAHYYGAELEHGSLVPAPGSAARLGAITYDAWLRR